MHGADSPQTMPMPSDGCPLTVISVTEEPHTHQTWLLPSTQEPLQLKNELKTFPRDGQPGRISTEVNPVCWVPFTNQSTPPQTGRLCRHRPQHHIQHGTARLRSARLTRVP